MHPMELPEASCLQGVSARVTGGLAMPHWGRAYLTHGWRGVAVGEEALVAIAFLTDANGTRWAQSLPGWGNAVYLEVGCTAWDLLTRASLTIGSYVWPPVREGSLEEISERSRGTRLPGGEIQTPVRWGWTSHLNGHAGPSEATALPPAAVDGETGRLLRFFAIGGDSPLTLDLLLVPRRLVRVHRLRIWHLRRRYQAGVPEPLRRVLSFDRAGAWPPQIKGNHRYVW